MILIYSDNLSAVLAINKASKDPKEKNLPTQLAKIYLSKLHIKTNGKKLKNISVINFKEPKEISKCKSYRRTVE
jgi:hypothetical protein